MTDTKEQEPITRCTRCKGPPPSDGEVHFEVWEQWEAAGSPSTLCPACVNTVGVFVGPIEVILTHRNLEVTCLVVRDDETTDTLSVDSLSMRGAQREITGYLLRGGLSPVGRWADVAEHRGEVMESARRFRRVK